MFSEISDIFANQEKQENARILDLQWDAVCFRGGRAYFLRVNLAPLLMSWPFSRTSASFRFLPGTAPPPRKKARAPGKEADNKRAARRMRRERDENKQVVYPDTRVCPDIGVYPDIGAYPDIGVYHGIGVYPDSGIYPDI